MKIVTYFLKRSFMKCDNWTIIDLSHRDYDEMIHNDAMQELDAMQEGHNYHPATRNGHITALECLPVIPGTKWVICEASYDEMIGSVPPRTRSAGGFYCGEANCDGPSGGTIYSAYYRDAAGLYWHEYEEVM